MSSTIVITNNQSIDPPNEISLTISLICHGYLSSYLLRLKNIFIWMKYILGILRLRQASILLHLLHQKGNLTNWRHHFNFSSMNFARWILWACNCAMSVGGLLGNRVMLTNLIVPHTWSKMSHGSMSEIGFHDGQWV